MAQDTAAGPDVADLAGLPLHTGHLSDAMDELGIAGGRAPGARVLAPEGMTAIGPAFTLRQEVAACEADGTPPMTRHAEAARELAAPGDILVIDVGAHPGIATWGEAQTLRALARGLAGVLIHGATRDAAGIRRRGLPVACYGLAPARSAGRLRTRAIGEPVEVAGLRIAPGDLVAFDEDGIVCVPAAESARVLERARRIAQREVQRDRGLEAVL